MAAPLKFQIVVEGIAKIQSDLVDLLNSFKSLGGAKPPIDVVGTSLDHLEQSAKHAADGIRLIKDSSAAVAGTKPPIDAAGTGLDHLEQSAKHAADGIRSIKDASAAVAGTKPPIDAAGTGLDHLEQSAKHAADGIRSIKDASAAVAGTKPPIDAAGTSLDHLEQSAKHAADGIRLIKDASAAVAGALAFLGVAAHEAIAFESAMTDVKKVVDASPRQFAELTGTIRELATQLPMTAVGLAQIAEAGGQLGISVSDLPDFIKLSSEMAVGFKMSADASGDAAGKMANIFALSMPQVRSLADSVNALGDSMAATERDIINVLQRSGGMGRQFGLDAKQVAALASTFLSLGDSPEIAGTAINNLLSKLQSAPVQTAAFQGTLQALGFSATGMAQAIEKDAQGALLTFLQSLEKLDAKTRTMALGSMFGAGMDTASISKLTQNLGQYEQALSKAQSAEAQGGLSKASALQNETAAAALDRLSNSIKDIGIAMGKALLPLTKLAADAAGAFAQFAAKVVDLAPIASTVALALGGAVAGLVAFALMAGLAAPILGTFGIASGAAGVAAGGASIGIGLMGAAVRLLLGPIGMAITAIGLLAAGWEWFQNRKKKTEDAKGLVDLTAERDALKKELEAMPASDGKSYGAASAGAGRKQELEGEMAALEGRISALDKEASTKLQEVSDAQKVDYGKQDDKSAEILAASEAGQAAAKARLEAAKQGIEARAKLAHDNGVRELADLEIQLGQELISTDAFYSRKSALAKRDSDNAIAAKRAEIALLSTQKFSSEADKEKQKGDLAKLNTEMAGLQAERKATLVGIERERIAAELKLAEDGETRRVGIMQRGLDEMTAIAKQARAVGEIDAAGLAAVETAAAERRVQIEIDAKRRILDERKRAGAPAADIKTAEADVETAVNQQRTQRSDRLVTISERTRQTRETVNDITISANADPAVKTVADAGKRIKALMDQSEQDLGVLQVQMQVEDDPTAKARIEQVMTDITRTTADAIAAEQGQLADKMKPGWQKMVEGWQDTNRLMRDASDQSMQALLKGGEEAFVGLVKTGKLNTQKIIDDLLTQFAKVQYQKLMGGLMGGDSMGADKAAKPGAQGGPGGALGAVGGFFNSIFSTKGVQPETVQNAAGGDGVAVGADVGAAAGGADPVAQASDKTTGALTALASVAGQNTEVGSALTLVQQGLNLAQTAGAVTEEATTVTLTTSLMALTAAAQAAALALSQAAASAGAKALIGMAADGAVIPFARGGAFTNSIVASPTLFAFAGGKKLGLMGEAGREAIMPLDGHGGPGAVDETGKPLPINVGLTRARSGRLSAVVNVAALMARSMVSAGPIAAMQAPASPSAKFATGGVFGDGGSAGASPSSVTRMAPSTAGNAAQAPAASISITMTNTFASGVDANAVNNAMQRIKAETLAAVADAQRRGNRSYT